MRKMRRIKKIMKRINSFSLLIRTKHIKLMILII